MEELRNAHETLVGELNGKYHLGDLDRMGG
jgi:hypothetical protein